MPSESEIAELNFRTVDMARWGAGLGRNLLPEEVDENFWNIIQRILTLETNPAQAVGISNIQVVGTQLKIFLEDGQEFGPFQLPIAAFTWRGEWEAATLYNELDLFMVPGKGIYLVLHNHESATEFDPAEEESDGPLYIQLFGVQTSYDLGFYFPGTPGNGIGSGKAMFAFRADRPFWIPAGMIGSVWGLEVAADAEMVFPILKNDDPIGTATIAAGQMVATFDFPDDVQFEIDDRYRVIRPDDLDATAEELTATVAGRRGTI